MNLDAATFNLIFIGAPGVLCYFTLSKLIGRVGRGSLEVVMLIFMYAVGSYILYGFAGRLAHEIGWANPAAELVIGSPAEMRLRAIDVAGASLAGLVLALFFAYGHRFNWINRVAQKMGATNRAGDEDVWHFLHNATEKEGASEWVVVRDHKVGLQYFGSVSHWSESGEDRELLLMQVSVFSNADGQKLYDCEHIYLCRNKDDLTIEIHNTNKE